MEGGRDACRRAEHEDEQCGVGTEAPAPTADDRRQHSYRNTRPFIVHAGDGNTREGLHLSINRRGGAPRGRFGGPKWAENLWDQVRDWGGVGVGSCDRESILRIGHERGEMELEDTILWARSGEGDAEAFTMLFERHAKTIYTYCFRRIGDWSAAEDLLSIVFQPAA